MEFASSRAGRSAPRRRNANAVAVITRRRAMPSSTAVPPSGRPRARRQASTWSASSRNVPIRAECLRRTLGQRSVRRSQVRTLEIVGTFRLVLAGRGGLPRHREEFGGAAARVPYRTRKSSTASRPAHARGSSGARAGRDRGPPVALVPVVLAVAWRFLLCRRSTINIKEPDPRACPEIGGQAFGAASMPRPKVRGRERL